MAYQRDLYCFRLCALRFNTARDDETAVSFDLDLQRLGEQTSAVVAAHREGDLDDLLRREELCKTGERGVVDVAPTNLTIC
jgi:hypothetical protein